MAKPFRDGPLVKVDDSMGLPVLPERTKAMYRRFTSLVYSFDDDFILTVASEIGLDECVSYDPHNEEKLVFDLTDLQLVSFCCALAACEELRESGGPARNQSAKRKRRG